MELTGSNPPVQFYYFPEWFQLTFAPVFDIYRCDHSTKIYFAVLSMALNLSFSILQNEI